MAYPESGAKYKHEPAWLNRAKHAEGGSISTSMQRVGDDDNPDFKTQAALGAKGMVPSAAQQILKDGSLGPLNINPRPIKGE